MASDISIQDLSIVFKIIGEIFEIKIYSSVNKNIINFFFKTSNCLEEFNHFQEAYFYNRFFEILNPKISQGFFRAENTVDTTEKNNNEISLKEVQIDSNFKEKKYRDNKRLIDNEAVERKYEETDASNSRSVKMDFVEHSHEKGINNIKEIQQDLVPKNNAKKESNFFLDPILYKCIKTTLKFLKEKRSSIQSIENYPEYLLNKLLKIKDISLKAIAFNFSSFDESFIKAVKNQVHIITNNKIADIIPFAIVGYHYKENHKKDNSKSKKKKKKILHKKDKEYQEGRFYI